MRVQRVGTWVIGLASFLFALSLTPATGIEIDWADPRIQEVLDHRDEFQNWFLQGFYGRRGQTRDIITCALCETAGSIIMGWIRQGVPPEEIANNTISLCKALDIVKPDICEMIVPVYMDPILYMVNHHQWATIFDFCGIVLGGGLLPGCFNMNHTMIDWVVDMDYLMRPPVIEHPLVPADVRTVKVLHITDIHPDLHYVEGSLNDCGRPLCCRPDPEDDPSNSSISAGHWGDFLCDFPIKSTGNVLMDAATRHPDADFVMMTGDLVHHQVWNTTIEDNLAHYAAFFDVLNEAFPTTQIYPAIGNHEPHPCNMFPSSSAWDDFDLSWMYNFQADMYENHLTPEALETFRKGGYYTQLHAPGFRIVTLNTNFCYTNNFWILYESIDPEGHLDWFSKTMYAAERAGEKVWILGHVPPGSKDCWSKWSQQFHRIINRYQNIILAQFYGHTHNDEFRIFFDDTKDPPQPTGSLYIGASVTPYTDLNPGYKVFLADGVRLEPTWQIVDHETYVYDLLAANEAGASVEPTFYKEYSARESYSLEGFRPNDLWEFVQRMAVDDDLFLTYFKHWYKDSGKEALDEDCPSTEDVSECKFEFLCEIVNTDYTNKHCDILKELSARAKESSSST